MVSVTIMNLRSYCIAVHVYTVQYCFCCSSAELYLVVPHIILLYCSYVHCTCCTVYAAVLLCCTYLAVLYIMYSSALKILLYSTYCSYLHACTVSAAVLLSCTYLTLLHIMYSSELKILLYCSYVLYSVHAVLYCFCCSSAIRTLQCFTS